MGAAYSKGATGDRVDSWQHLGRFNLPRLITLGTTENVAFELFNEQREGAIQNLYTLISMIVTSRVFVILRFWPWSPKLSAALQSSFEAFQSLEFDHRGNAVCSQSLLGMPVPFEFELSTSLKY